MSQTQLAIIFFVLGLIALTAVVGILTTNNNLTDEFEPVFDGKIVTWYCNQNVVMSLQYAASSDHAELRYNGVRYMLTREPTASELRYTSAEAGVEYTEHQGAATIRLTSDTEPLQCSQNQPREEIAVDEPAMITVTNPERGVAVASPLTLSGEARGQWFFEANAPVVVTDWDGRIIGESYITAAGEWMTEDFVPFTGTIEYELPDDSYSASGTVIFQRSNPSDLPENDAAVEIPVVLEK